MKVIFDYIKRINKKPFQLKTQKIEESKQTKPETIDFDVDNRNRLINVKTFL